MENGTRFEVTMFNNFSISLNGELITENRHRDSQFSYLMQLLLHFREKGVSRSLMEDTLFMDRDVEDMKQSLRTVLYNTRKWLKSKGIDEDCIVVKSGIYYWQSSFTVIEDAALMEEYATKAEQTEDIDEKQEYLSKAVRLYTGEFLKMHGGFIWVADEQRKFSNLFRLCVEDLAEILREKKLFTDLKKLGEFASKSDPYSSHEALIIEALTEMGKYDEAQEFYEQTILNYTLEFGQYASETIEAVATKLGERMSHEHEELDDIKNKLIDSGDSSNHGYLCTFPVFQGIFQSVMRTMERKKDVVHLMLCTIVDEEGKPITKGKRFQELSDRLCDTIVESVRRSDTVTRYGKGQFLVLLINTTRENCTVVQKRINDKFIKGYQKISIQYDINL